MLPEIHSLASGGPVLIPLFGCSVVAVAVIIERSIALGGTRKPDAAARAIALVRAGRDDEARRISADLPTEGRVLTAAIDARMRGFAEIERAVSSAAIAAVSRLPRRLAVLDTIITLAPLLGLFGTVTGMIRAFGVMGTHGLSNPSSITGGISEALIATSIGLAIAIVTLAFYNALSLRVAKMAADVEKSVVKILAAYAARTGETLPDHRGDSRRRVAPPVLKRARIEIIPMIDTIFFLLVFFMMSVLNMVHLTSKRVQLPVSGTAQIKPLDMVVVTLAKDGSYYVDEQPVRESEIAGIVSARVREHPLRPIIINCDRTQPLTRFLRTYDLIKQGNPTQVLVAAKPDTSRGATQ